MIQTKSLTLDQEASIYLTTFFYRHEDTELPPQIQKKIRNSSSNSLFQGKTICYRCGQVGHLATQCPNELPDPEEIEKEMEKEIAELSQRLLQTGNYSTDEFGLYSTENSNQVPTDQSWQTTTFCPNCGKSHPQRSCPHPSYNELMNEMRGCFDGRSSYSADQIRKLFYNIWES